MNRLPRTYSTGAVIAIAALICATVVLLTSQSIVSGREASANPQSPFGVNDNFIFTNSSLKGTYAGVLDCTLVAGPTPAPCAVSYLYTADGNGNIINADATVNINGQTSFNINFPGTYTVETSGRVNMTIVPTNGPLAGFPMPISSVITETQGGQITELRGVDTAPGLVSTRVEKRIRK